MKPTKPATFSLDAPHLQDTARRYADREQRRRQNLQLIEAHRPLEVDSAERVERFLARRGLCQDEPRRSLAARGAERRPVVTDAAMLERVLGSNDLMGVAFLERGLEAARTVARIWMSVRAGRPLGYGTGFLISPRLLMTNHHVLGDIDVARKSLVEFDYQIDLRGRPSPTTTFELDVATFHFADSELDYAVVAVQPVAQNGRKLEDFGWNPLIEAEGKAIAAQWVNIIQHPQGQPKQLALRENQIVDVLDDFLHYKADTAPGSSGSPVFNDLWEVVGLHHSGVPKKNAEGRTLAVDGSVWRPEMGEDRIQWEVNEGARISRIVAHLRSQQMTPRQRAMFEAALQAPAQDAPHEAPPREAASAHRLAMVPQAARLDPVSGTHELAIDVHPRGAEDAHAAAGQQVTWTVPIQIAMTVSVDPRSITAAPRAAAARTAIVANGGLARDGASGVAAAALARARSDFEQLGFGAVRIGWAFRNGWITDERALIVDAGARTAATTLPAAERMLRDLPASFAGFPVQRAGLTPAVAPGLPAAAAAAESAIDSAAESTYFPPDDARLDRVKATMRVVAHVSPDAGWPQLRSFLSATRERLVVGMYDFGARHLVDEIVALEDVHGLQQFTLVMQHGQDVGGGTKADDLTDDEVVDTFKHTFGKRFRNAWVSRGAQGWVASSYHIKVAVRDRRALWLSSGNWQSSNQPHAEPLTEHPPRPTWLQNYNREWHAVVEHEGLARTYERYLLHDFAENRVNAPTEAAAHPDLLVPEAWLTLPEAAAGTRYFAPFDETREFDVQPLLTPDNYHEHVLRLIESAEHELLVQNQTFNAPKAGQGQLDELVKAVLKKQQAGVDVRIVFRVLFPSKARETLEALRDYGFDMASFRVQKNCHTKGIVVDRKRVLLGSQNWSNDGVSRNRDASLLFEDEELAQYFATIFDHDWQHLARQDIGSEHEDFQVAESQTEQAPGTRRITWKDYIEML